MSAEQPKTPAEARRLKWTQLAILAVMNGARWDQMDTAERVAALALNVEACRDFIDGSNEECTCTDSFGQLLWAATCGIHQKCPAMMRGIPIRCVLAADHDGHHK